MNGLVVKHGGDGVDGLTELFLDEVFDDELQSDWLANSRLSPEGRLVHPI
jgi:hypothetical protein